MIILIRHCTPKIDYSRCDHRLAAKRLQEYNTTNDISLSDIDPLREPLSQCLKYENLEVFCSSLPRAVITARNIFKSLRTQNISDLFIEFDLKILAIPHIKLKFVTWLIVSRIFWLFGMLKSARNFRQEIARSSKCAKFLLEKAQNQPVALVAHQALNFFIERSLKKQGYKQVSKMKNNCFTVIHLELQK